VPLETATFIPDLVVTNPAHTDGLSQADSHLRLLKSTLKSTFPNFTDVALNSTQAQIDAAVAATIAASSFPPGATCIWWDDALPAGFTWANGVPISRVANPILFARWGVKYGTGDGSTTFGTPNLCECVPVGKSTMGGASPRGFLTSVSSAVLNTLNLIFGVQSFTLTAANLPPITSTGVNAIVDTIPGGFSVPYGNFGAAAQVAISTTSGVFTVTTSGYGNAPSFTTNNTISVTSTGTLSTPVAIIQPSVTVNWIMAVG
jgi:microcystin-dependent protein